MRAFIRLITCCFYFFASGHLAGADLTDRVNQTVQLGNAFGVEVDSTIAFDQLETLSLDVFRAQFQKFADLNPSTVESYAETFPEEFWALNQYLSQLYRGGFITPDTLSDLRAASVQGLTNYQSTIAPEDFEPQTVTSQTATPELNRFVEIARQIQSGQSVSEIARDSTEGAIEQRVRDEGREQLSFIFPNAKLETRIFTDDGPEISAGFITSIVENETSNVFGQTNLSNNSDGSKISMGLGYRTLDPTGSSLLGLNAFVDHDFEKEHTRGSVGVEVQNNFISGNANQYFSLSDYKPKTSRILHKPADGYDARLEMAIPYFPNLFATYRNETWDLGDDGKVRREAIGLKGEIAPNVVLKLENQSSTGDRSNQNIGSLTYTYVPDGHDGNAPIEYRDPITVFDTYKHRFVDRDESMPLATRYINSPPVANDTTININEGSTHLIDVSSLISDPDSDPLTVTTEASPTEGSASLNGTTFTYQQTTENPSTTDQIVYRVTDPYRGTDTGTIFINITAVNDPPLAQDSSISVADGGSQTIDVASLISDPEGDDLTVTVANGSLGTTSVDGTVITYQNTQSGLSDSFVYIVDDGNGGTDAATITVTITLTTADQCTDIPTGSYNNGGAILTAADITDPPSQFFWDGNNHIYEIVRASASWENSRERITRVINGVPGHLATITSEAEQEFIASIISEGTYWLGANNLGPNNCWRWTEGPEAGLLLDFGYTNWPIGKPVDEADHNYLELNYDEIDGARWNNTHNGDNNIFIVEYSGE